VKPFFLTIQKQKEELDRQTLGNDISIILIDANISNPNNTLQDSITCNIQEDIKEYYHERCY
jgi:hypothetical protein